MIFSPRKFRISTAVTVCNVCIDGEVCVHKPQLVLKFLRYAVKHVLNVATHTAQHGKLLGLCKIHPGPYFLITISKPELDGQVAEIASKSAMFACHLNNFGFDGDLNVLRDLEHLLLN